jgi:spore cortex formation protein SpoVR/YcgB (stage V sporulation)
VCKKKKQNLGERKTERTLREQKIESTEEEEEEEEDRRRRRSRSRSRSRTTTQTTQERRRQKSAASLERFSPSAEVLCCCRNRR